MRQRLRIHRSPLVFVGKGLLTMLALGLLWYGGMVVALAFKASQSTVETLSGYRAAYDFLANLTPQDLTDRTRLTVGLAGLAGFLLFGFLAFKELPRPRLARSGVDLTAEDDLGTTAVAPRALERVAEIAAIDDLSVAVAAGRLEDDQMSLNLKLLRARELPADLRAAQRRARQALADHGVPVSAVNVTVAAFDKIDPTGALMMERKQYAALIGFAFVAAWISFNFGYAVLCVVGAAVFYFGASYLEGEVDLIDLQERFGPRRSGRGSGGDVPKPQRRARVE